MWWKDQEYILYWFVECDLPLGDSFCTVQSTNISSFKSTNATNVLQHDEHFSNNDRCLWLVLYKILYLFFWRESLLVYIFPLVSLASLTRDSCKGKNYQDILKEICSRWTFTLSAIRQEKWNLHRKILTVFLWERSNIKRGHPYSTSRWMKSERE